MWSFLKHFEGAQPGKRKPVAATTNEDDNMILRLNKEIELEIEREF